MSNSCAVSPREDDRESATVGALNGSDGDEPVRDQEEIDEEKQLEDQSASRPFD